MKRFCIISLICVVVLSCRKDEKIETITPTDYDLNLPGIMAQYLPPMPIPEDNPLTEEGVELGRKLFYDTKLSADNSQSCATCHSPEHAFTDNNQFSTGIDGFEGNRNSMSLINLGWMSSLFWDGRSPTIEKQALEPVLNPIEMHNTWGHVVATLQADPIYPGLFLQAFGSQIIDSIKVSKALAQFERTLISGNSPFDRYLRGEPTGMTEQEELEAYQGFALFMDESKGDCFHCHGDSYNPLWTDNLFHNNGLDATITDKGLGSFTGNPIDDGKFKTPTLRNLKYSAPYMHDGRFSTLAEVVNHYSSGLQDSPTIDPLMKSVDQGGVLMSPEERSLLVKFLLSLSDSTFITNPKFQAP